MGADVSAREKALFLVRRLREEGYEAYFAGGCVRDDLLGKNPKDYDVATNARPEAVQQIFPKTIPVGSQFGVVLVVLDGDTFEVATFRFDGPYLDGRHPSHVRYGTLEEDVKRRDFTINGMMFDPLSDRVIDLVGGKEDLKQGLIRAIGEPRSRLEEDQLRMIRAVRLAAGMDFTIEERTFQALQDLAPSITSVAWERIGEEITRLLTEGGARKGFELLDRAKLLEIILPEVAAMKGVEQTPDFHPEGDVWAHTLTLLGHLRQPTETLAYGCLLHDIAKPVCISRDASRITFYGHSEKGSDMAVDILKRLKRSRAAWERIAYLVKNHLRHTQAPNMRLSTLKRFLAEEGVEELLELTRIDALSSNGDLRYYDFCLQKMEELKQKEIRPSPLLTGTDLIAMGLSPGPLFGEILRRVEEAQLEGELKTKEEAESWVRQNYLGK